jgi:Endoplasmic reticulum-based factor for assembly of V-ATPase
MKKIIGLCTLCLLFSAFALADVRLPEPIKPLPPTPKIKQKNTTMQITIDENATETVLKLNKSSIKQLRAALDEVDDSNDATAEVKSVNTPQTIIGGVFLSLAFVFGGVWMFRSKPSKTVVGVFLLVSLLSATTFVFANIAPPMKIRKITSEMFSEEVNKAGYTSGKIKIQIGDKKTMSQDVELIVPKTATDNEEEE